MLAKYCSLLGVESIPSDWQLAQLGDVVSYAKRPRALAVTERTPFVPMALISETDMSIASWELRDPSEIGSGTYFEAGDLLVGRITPCFENGKQGIAPAELPGGWGLATTEVYALRSDELDMRYLHFFLKIDAVRTSLIESMEGATGRMRLPREALDRLPVAWPTRTEQASLVEQILRLTAGWIDVEEQLTQAAALARRLGESLLESAVRGEITVADASISESDYRALVLERREKAWRSANPQKTHYPRPLSPESDPDFVPRGWAVMSLDELTTGDRTSAYGVLQPGPDVPGGVPLVRVGDLAQRRVKGDGLKRIDPQIAASYARTELHGGELLVSLVGTIGRCGVAPPTLLGANVARAVGMFPLADQVHPEFVAAALSAPSAQRRLVGAANEVARKTLNLNDLRRFPVAVPPLAQQQEITARVTELEQLARAALQQSNAARDDLGELRQSIARDAVTGRWPDDHDIGAAASESEKSARAALLRSSS